MDKSNVISDTLTRVAQLAIERERAKKREKKARTSLEIKMSKPKKLEIRRAKNQYIEGK